jgi:hypothetical protein
LNEACELIALALQKGRVGTKSGESVTQHSLRGTSEPSESVTQADEFVEDTSEDQLSDQEQLSEFVSNNSPDFPIACAKKSQKKGKTRLRQKKGESETLFATNSPDRGHLSTHLGESAAAVSFIDHLSLENITNNGSITMNDAAPSPTHSPSTYKDPRPIDDIRHDAADLAERLDGSRKSRWLAKLITCVQRFPPHVRRLAEIDTLYHSAFPDYRGKPKVPGAWFAKRCEEYANPEWKTKNEIRQWNESGMDLMAIHQEMQRGRHTPIAMILPFDAELEDAVQSQRDNLDDGPARDVVPCSLGKGDTWEQIQEVLHHSLLHTRMDQHQAEALCKHIRQEGLAFGIQADVYPGDHEGEFVVVTSWDGNEEEWTNASEWNRYFEKVKKCYQKNGVR